MLAISNGVMKPCTIAFGGDQFQLPQQAVQMKKYYSLLYVVMKTAALSATLAMPMLRSDLTSITKDQRYMVIFGVLLVMSATTASVFGCGSRLYVKKPPSGNRIVPIVKCMWASPFRNTVTKSLEKRFASPTNSMH